MWGFVWGVWGLECGVWSKTAAQVWSNAPVCYDKFAMHYTAIFWVI
jgi:hypothetical protein